MEEMYVKILSVALAEFSKCIEILFPLLKSTILMEDQVAFEDLPVEQIDREQRTKASLHVCYPSQQGNFSIISTGPR